MADYLIKNSDIPKDLILLEIESISTLTNWTYSLKLFPDILCPDLFDNNKQLGLVSHPNHLNRIIFLAKKLGFGPDTLQKIPTDEEDDKIYKNKLLKIFKKYLSYVSDPIIMEEKEQEIASNVELMKYLQSKNN